MSWFYLLIAGLLEIVWAIGLKFSEGFTKPLQSVVTVIGMILSFYMLSLSLKTIPLGTAYAVWTGIGATGTAIIGMFFLGESKELARIICILLIITGIVGLKLYSD
jgi:quaternary ammonium compound-resistance protein SugE